METLELENLLDQAVVSIESALNRQESRGAQCPRGLRRARRPELDEAHHLLAGRERQVTIDYRPVHMQPLSNDVQSFPPKARVY